MPGIEKTTEILDADLIEERDTSRPESRYWPWVFALLMVAGVGYGAHRGWTERQRLLGEVAQSQSDLQHAQSRLAALQAERNNLVGEKVALQLSLQSKEAALAQAKEAQAKADEEHAKGAVAVAQPAPEPARSRPTAAHHQKRDHRRASGHAPTATVASRR